MEPLDSARELCFVGSLVHSMVLQKRSAVRHLQFRMQKR